MKLKGSLDIRKYLGVSEPTFMEYVTNGGLPVKKDKTGAEFIADTKELDDWRGVQEKTKVDEQAAEGGPKAKTKDGVEAKATAKK